MGGPALFRPLVILLLTWQVTTAYYTNLLVNPGFETDIKWIWRENGFTLARYQGDVLQGQYSVKCSGRTNELHGPFQRDVPLLKGRHYAFEGYVKLLQNVPGKPWQTIKAAIQMSVPFQTVALSYNIAYRSFCNVSQGWIKLKGDLDTPQVDFSDVKLSIKGPDPGVDFLVDNVTLYEMPENPNWRQDADSNVETYRKSDLTLNVNLPAGVSPSDIDIQIKQKSHEFIFGSMVRDEYTAEQPPNEYMKIFYYLFDWATVQSYKWKYNKGNPPYIPDFSRATEASDILIANGKKVRGHSIFWDVEKNVPDWVKALSVADTMPALVTHLQYMMNLTKNRVQQFDVQNEYIAGHYYEEKLSNPAVTKEMFKLARTMNTSIKLYLNDFQCVTHGAQTEQLFDLAKDLLSAGPIVDGLGIQGHTKEFIKPDPTHMWRRLDRLALTGLDLMMTEFDLGWHDEMERADWLEDALRAFFAHPKLKGIIMWDFYNKTMRDLDHGLVADDLTFMEPGERYACLVRKEWTTKKQVNLGTSGTTFSLRAFQGDYDVLVKRSGVPVQKESFHLGTQGATWNLAVTSNTGAITVPAEVDYVPQCISHRQMKSVGTATSSSGATLTCRTVQSSSSGPNYNDAVSVSCASDEVLTGCSSFHTQLYATRNGEKIEVVNGAAQCTAYNGANSPDGVMASAQCCKLAGLSCDYRVAGPSYPFDGAMAEALCQPGDRAISCSSYQAYPVSDGGRPSDSNLSGCRAQSGAPYNTNPAQKSGAFAFASCCHASNLECVVVESSPSSLTQGTQKSSECPAGYAMTGCSSFADSGRSGGTRVWHDGTTDKCKAYMGADLPDGSTGVTSIATCCRVP